MTPQPLLPGFAREQPLFLAPLEEITDGPFRRLARRWGADLVFTEFVSADGLIHGAPQSRRKLVLSAAERPVGIQVCGHTVDAMVRAACMAAEAQPDLIDLNAGCPARKVTRSGAGSALLRTPELLEAIARAVVRAVAPLPVTAKLRLGWDAASINAIEVAQRLAGVGVAALTLHARTRGQGFRGSADWSWIARVRAAVAIPVVGNGDVWEPADAQRMFAQTGCAAVMIGRAAIGNPWIFSQTHHYLETGQLRASPPAPVRFACLLEHLREAVPEKGERRAVIEMRKHYRGYLRGLPGAAMLRAALMKPQTVDDVSEVLASHMDRTYAPGGGPPAGAGEPAGTLPPHGAPLQGEQNAH